MKDERNTSTGNLPSSDSKKATVYMKMNASNPQLLMSRNVPVRATA